MYNIDKHAVKPKNNVLLRLLSLAVILLAFLHFPLHTHAQNGVQIALEHVRNTAVEYGLSRLDVQDLLVTDNLVSNKSRMRHIYLRQAHQGIGIYGANLNLGINQADEVIFLNNRALPSIANKINTVIPQLMPGDAVRAAAFAYGLPQPAGLQVIQPAFGDNRATTLSDGGISQEPIPVRLMFVATDPNTLRLVWDLSILPKAGNHWWSLRIDALNGSVLSEADWMTSCGFEPPRSKSCQTATRPSPDFAASRVLAPNTYNVFAAPVESPSHGGRTLKTNPWVLSASPFGWHDTNGANGPEFTITRGNNVHAQEDANGNDGNGFSPDGGPTLDFDFPLNINQAPNGYRDVAITNLFYWNNLMHDVWHGHGFDETSGNFQQNNYGNGGANGDYVLADAQDGGGTNNANFGTPPDGTRPRMQMYLWSAQAAANFQVNSPAVIAGSYNAVQASFGPGLPGTPLTRPLVLVDDGTAAPTEACNALTNGGAINGNIALLDRGNCIFVNKVLNAQNAGAVACVVCNDTPGAPFAMAGANGAITIPSVMISQADCALLKAQLGGGVNVSLSGSGGNFMIDGDFDNGIIAHEYGHGISNRLTGGPGNSNCLNNAEQMGEGWSDWFGLMLTMQPADVGAKVRGIGTFAIGENPTGNGIRPAPYSTDMNVNPFTYGDITNTGAISQPHGIGFLWCNMLWEMSWGLINQFGFDPDLVNGTGGNNIAMDLVIEAIKTQPCSPGFVDGRDAILLADQTLFGGVHTCLIWTAFAKRGLGASASQGSANSRSDGSEAFDLPAVCQNFPVEWLAVSATALKREILVDWEVAQEVQNRGFEIERSAEDQVAFVKIGFVEGKGNSNVASAYNFLDQNVKPGITYKYRLRQLDLNGQFQFSKVVTARIDASKLFVVYLFPNPTTGILNLEMENVPHATLKIEVFNLLGEQVYSNDMAGGLVNTPIRLDLSNLASGQYLLKIMAGTQLLVKRIVVESD